MMSYIFWNKIYVSGEHAATIFRAEKYAKQGTRLYLRPALW
jgi:hypothetical protein